MFLSIYKLGAFAAASAFCEWVQVGIDIYIYMYIYYIYVYIYIYIYIYIDRGKYHVKSHSSPWFLAPCAAAVVCRNCLKFR